jgi:hypothetical protein
MSTRWYRGDCHVHSVASHGGELTPKQLAADARAAGLDFIATTEHNRTDTHELLRKVRAVGGLCVAAHPHAPYESGTLPYPIADFDLIEVWNGLWSSSRPWNADNEAGLADWAHSLSDDVARGQWRPAIGSSDMHPNGAMAAITNPVIVA